MVTVQYMQVVKANLGNLPANAPQSLSSLERQANQWFGHFGRRIAKGHMQQYPKNADFECVLLAGVDNGYKKDIVGIGSIFVKGASVDGKFVQYRYLDKLAVDPDFSGNGIGKGIIQYAVDLRREEGLPSLHALRTSVNELNKHYHEIGTQLCTESGINHVGVYSTTSFYCVHFFGHKLDAEESLKELAEAIAAEKASVFPVGNLEV